MKKGILTKKVLALLLVALMLVALLPMGALATDPESEEETVFLDGSDGGGSGGGSTDTTCPDCGATYTTGESHTCATTECPDCHVTYYDLRGHTCATGGNGGDNTTACAKCSSTEHATESCTCTCDGTHNPDNADCPLNQVSDDELVEEEAVLPEPLVESNYGEPQNGTVSVSVTWDDDVQAGTAVYFSLEYTRNDDGTTGVVNQKSAVKPANAVVFSAPEKVVKTTVTTPLDVNWMALSDQATSETSEIGYSYSVIALSADEGYKATADGLSVHVSKKTDEDVAAEALQGPITVQLNWYSFDEYDGTSFTIGLKGTDKTATVSQGTSSYTFYDLPLKDADGNAITYEAEVHSQFGYEVRASGLAVTVTARSMEELYIDKAVTISWSADIPAEKTPEITLNMAYGGKNESAKVAKGTSEYTFTLMSQDNKGNAIDVSNPVLTATAPYGYNVSVDGMTVTVTYNAEEAANFTSKTVTIDWPEIPAGSFLYPSIVIRLAGVAGTETDIYSSNITSHTFNDLPMKDAEGNEITYTVEAEPRANGFSTSCSGLAVTVTLVNDEAAAQVVTDIIALINTLPATVPDDDTDPETIENLDGIRATLQRIESLMWQLTSEKQSLITNKSIYDGWSSYIASLDGDSGVMLLNYETDPGSVVVTIGGTVAFSDVGTYTVPPTVEIKLLQNGRVVASQGITTGGVAGSKDYSFGTWSKYSPANVPYNYTVIGTPVTNFSSSSEGYAIKYKGLTDPVGGDSMPFPVTVNFDHRTNTPAAIANVKATVKMFKNGVAVTGQEHEFTANGTHPFTVNAKSGDVIYPVASDIAGYKVESSGLTFTYTYIGDKKSFSGTITWINAPRFNKPELSITLEGSLITNPATKLSPPPNICTSRMDPDATMYTFNELLPEYSYVLKDVVINRVVADDNNYSVSFTPSGAITVNRSTDPLMRIGVTMRWVDNNNKREKRPSETTVYLYRDGKYTGDEEQIRAYDGWQTIFFDQPYSDGAGHVYKYSVRVARTEHYWPRYTRLSNTGFLITMFYGRWKSDDTSGTTPKVGDPTVFRTALSDRMYAEAAKSMEAVRNVAVLNDSVDVPGAVDFDTLKRINEDVVAWITLDGTAIDYPIVRGSDNTEYMTRLFSGEANSSGSIFMDSKNDAKFSNRNTTVYGHNMKDGSMFNTLLEYQNQSFYDAHGSFLMQTPNGDYTLEPIAGFYTDAAYSNVVKRTFANNEAFMSYVDKCLRASSFQSSAAVNPTDKLVTFVTCSNDYNDGRRFVLVCKLTPAN